MHTKDARARGEGEQRLYALHMAPADAVLTDRERAALAWTEAITLLSERRTTDKLFEGARQHFSEKQLVDLTMAIIAINGWNRLSVAFRTVPGTYRAAARPSQPLPAPDRVRRWPRRGGMFRNCSTGGMMHTMAGSELNDPRACDRWPSWPPVFGRQGSIRTRGNQVRRTTIRRRWWRTWSLGRSDQGWARVRTRV